MVSSSSSESLRDPGGFGRQNIILKRHKPEYAERVKAYAPFYQVLALIIADYVVEGELFDRDAWREYYGVDIGPETEEVKNALDFDYFYGIYHGPNPRDLMMRKNNPTHPVRQVCETSFIPTVRPERYTYLSGSPGWSFDYTLRTAILHAEHPIKGRPAEYVCQNEVLEQHGTGLAGRSCVIILLKDLVAYDLCRDEQIVYLQDLNDLTGYRCELELEALSLITVLFAHNVITGERSMFHYSRTCEYIRNGAWSNHMVVGDLYPNRSTRAELFVGSPWVGFEERIGMAILRNLSIRPSSQQPGPQPHSSTCCTLQ